MQLLVLPTPGLFALCIRIQTHVVRISLLSFAQLQTHLLTGSEANSSFTPKTMFLLMSSWPLLRRRNFSHNRHSRRIRTQDLFLAKHFANKEAERGEWETF